MINYWQRGVPVYERKVMTPTFVALLALVAVGTVLGITRLLGSLGPFSGMNDAYAWGVWKTFNVMTLTAMGSGGLAVGFAAWVMGHKSLHVAMRTALITSIIFYGTGMLALLTDVGRPWNFYHAAIPWHWNGSSALLEVAVCMTAYVALFLLFEVSPTVVERLWFTGSPARRRLIERWEPTIRRAYPFVIAGAYILPMMHQSSLGGLLLLAGPKIHPLWQTQMLPLLYLVQAFACGFGAVILFLMGSCLVWRRPLDMAVLSDLGRLMAWTLLGWVGLRMVDIVARGQLGAAFAMTTPALLFHLENGLMVLPGVVLLSPRMRRTPRALFTMTLVGVFGGLLYRFTPTTIAYDPGRTYTYFPSLPEVVLTVGFIAFALAIFSVSVKVFAVLPAPLSRWYALVKTAVTRNPHFKRDEHGNPIDD